MKENLTVTNEDKSKLNGSTTQVEDRFFTETYSKSLHIIKCND